MSDGSTHTDESAGTPTCRACYAATLTPSQRERFYAEPVTSCIYWCDDHHRAMDAVLNALPSVQFIRTAMSAFEPPMFAPVIDGTPPGGEQ